MFHACSISHKHIRVHSFHNSHAKGSSSHISTVIVHFSPRFWSSKSSFSLKLRKISFSLSASISTLSYIYYHCLRLWIDECDIQPQGEQKSVRKLSSGRQQEFFKKKNRVFCFCLVRNFNFNIQCWQSLLVFSCLHASRIVKHIRMCTSASLFVVETKRLLSTVMWQQSCSCQYIVHSQFGEWVSRERDGVCLYIWEIACISNSNNCDEKKNNNKAID